MNTIDTIAADMLTYPATSSTVVTSPQAVEFVNGALRRMVRRHNWRCMQASVDLGFAAAQAAVALPPDYCSEAAVYSKDPNQTDPNKALVPIAKQQKPAVFSNLSPAVNTDPIFPSVALPSAQPYLAQQRGYYVWANVLTIVPTPTQALTVQLDYYRTLDDLVAGNVPAYFNTLTALYPDTVRWGALTECYDYLHETDMAVRAEAVFGQRLVEAINHDNATAFAGTPQSRGK